ncbi:MAG: hypothetical protein QXF12_01565 [Candidatus Aenigmatarchaeota archaeon]
MDQKNNLPAINKDKGQNEITKKTGDNQVKSDTTSNFFLKKKYIYVQFQKEGIHCFPEAAYDHRYATGDWDDVSFLANEHFHYFYFKVKIEVFENNREIEFIQFRRWLERLYNQGTLSLKNKSCEMIAEDLLEYLKCEFPNRDITVEVYEDNINGAIVEYKRENIL